MELAKVLPYTAEVNEKNHLVVGGCDLVELAQEFGTPLFVYDEETIRENIRRYKRAFASFTENFEIVYAGKAFLCKAICQLIAEEGLSVDVSSGGEVYTVMKAAFPPERVYFHGNNKTEEEIDLALSYSVGGIIIDSFDEIELLEEKAKGRKEKVRVFLRITPGVIPSTHSFIQTGQVDSKFGFGLAGGLALKATKRVLESSILELRGFHIHIGSQIFVLHSYARAVEVIMEFINQVKTECGFVTLELNLGGGLGISYQTSDEPSTIEEFAEVIIEGVSREVMRYQLEMPKIMVEPGRSIVGQAAVTIYRVGTVKEIPGIRTYVSVDGGMSDNLRPMLYGAVYEALLVNRANEQEKVKVTVAGKHCESGDILIKEAYLPMPRRGDYLCTPSTGAYGYAMANNYNRQPRPAVVMVKTGKVKVIIEKESFEDLIRLDRPYF